MEEEREADRPIVRPREEDLGGGMRAEERVAQLILRRAACLEQLFVLGKASNHAEDNRHIGRGGRDDAQSHFLPVGFMKSMRAPRSE